MNDWVKAMGIDYGTARIGIAVSDDIGLLAHPLETVAATDLDRAAGRIATLVRERKTEDLVVGLPLHMNGEEGDAVTAVRAFVERLRPLLPETIRIHEMDERHTTRNAMAKLHAAGRNTKNTKKIIDQAAAIEILQEWLDLRVG